MQIKFLSKPDTLYLCMSALFSKTLIKRAFGLIILNNFKDFDGLVIENCKIIHSFFMRFSFDVLFLDKSGNIIAIYNDFKPFRISKFHKRTKYVIELPLGTVKKMGITLVDKIDINYS